MNATKATACATHARATNTNTNANKKNTTQRGAADLTTAETRIQRCVPNNGLSRLRMGQT
jgi:hypothetical protein